MIRAAVRFILLLSAAVVVQAQAQAQAQLSADGVRPAGKFPVLAPSSFSASSRRHQGEVLAHTLFGLVAARDLDYTKCPEGPGYCRTTYATCCGTDKCLYDNIKCCNSGAHACAEACCGLGCMPKDATCCDDETSWSHNGQSGCNDEDPPRTLKNTIVPSTRELSVTSSSSSSSSLPTSAVAGGCGSSVQKVLHEGAAYKGRGGSSGSSDSDDSSSGGGSGTSSQGTGCTSEASKLVGRSLLGITIVGAAVGIVILLL